MKDTFKCLPSQEELGVSQLEQTLGDVVFKIVFCLLLLSGIKGEFRMTTFQRFEASIIFVLFWRTTDMFLCINSRFDLYVTTFKDSPKAIRTYSFKPISS